MMHLNRGFRLITVKQNSNLITAALNIVDVEGKPCKSMQKKPVHTRFSVDIDDMCWSSIKPVSILDSQSFEPLVEN